MERFFLIFIMHLSKMLKVRVIGQRGLRKVTKEKWNEKNASDSRMTRCPLAEDFEPALCPLRPDISPDRCHIICLHSFNQRRENDNDSEITNYLWSESRCTAPSNHRPYWSPWRHAGSTALGQPRRRCARAAIWWHYKRCRSPTGCELRNSPRDGNGTGRRHDLEPLAASNDYQRQRNKLREIKDKRKIN